MSDDQHPLHPQAQVQQTSNTTDQINDVILATTGKIISLLETFPYISRTMIQVGLSPALPPKLWSPILDELVEKGEILKHSLPVTNNEGRTTTKVVYHLPKFPYPPVTAV